MKKLLNDILIRAEINGFDTSSFLRESRFEKFKFHHMFSVLDKKDIYFIIFSHEFAKAFWGDGEERQVMSYAERCCLDSGLPFWKHNLQQMVLEEEPIKYLEQFLGG